MRRRPALSLLCLVACGIDAAAAQATPPLADPASDAPEHPATAGRAPPSLPSYAVALQRWRDADDVNAWIAARFVYDRQRALQLSETQRQQGLRLPIHEPEDFFAEPSGVCVDLARFGVETLRVIDPPSDPAYLMIEFDPVALSGQTLRRHWLVSFRRDGQRYFFADSKRPGYIAGPYADTSQFIADYARYRGRTIVAYREQPSFERSTRRRAPRAGATSSP